MTKHTSKDLKEKIVQRKKGGYSIHEIMELSSLKRTQVYGTLKLHRETGPVQNPYARPRGRKRILTIDDHTFVERRHSLLVEGRLARWRSCSGGFSVTFRDRVVTARVRHLRDEKRAVQFFLQRTVR